ncbi:predicted protein [Plenodomus lingam JN3]|uniref:Predicted protein n=1 Tax=Leptosphaeria maculans (strain JN3 / isolate v23.1.3 / race Av1-4-5-6-7-8) TaxID=985895 RepID=E4ZTQ7_LEPMJ|nr:predicted protein [Plenodomus lingam JN3]CBX94617.1 predicted protein [Plenodomus lingam JN3]
MSDRYLSVDLGQYPRHTRVHSCTSATRMRARNRLRQVTGAPRVYGQDYGRHQRQCASARAA